MEIAKDIVQLLYQFAGLILIFGGLFWTFNKTFLSATYLSKKEFVKFIENHQGSEKNHDTELNDLKADFRVYKSEQHGANELVKLQMNTFSEMMKVYFSQMGDMKSELLDKINNIPNKMVSAEKFMSLEDKVEELQKKSS